MLPGPVAPRCNVVVAAAAPFQERGPRKRTGAEAKLVHHLRARRCYHHRHLISRAPAEGETRWRTEYGFFGVLVAPICAVLLEVLHNSHHGMVSSSHHQRRNYWRPKARGIWEISVHNWRELWLIAKERDWLPTRKLPKKEIDCPHGN